MADNALFTDDSDIELISDHDLSTSRQSRVIRMNAKKFASELIFRYAWIWIVSLSLTAVTGIVLGITIDLKWLVVGLMVICIVIPMILAFLYYFYGFQRGCFINTLPHRIVLTDDGLIARLIITQNASSDTDNVSCESEDCSDNKTAERIRDEFFPFSQMRPFVIGNDSAIVPLKSPAKGFIWIPADAFNDESHLSDLLKILDKKIQQY